MSTKVAIDQATPRIAGVMSTSEEMVTLGTNTVAKVLASANIGNAPGVKAAATAWSVEITALAANNTAKATARAMLDTAIVNELQLVRSFGKNRRALAVAIDLFANGSKDTVQSFGVDVEARQARPAATIPVNLRPMKVKKTNYGSVRWDPTVGAQGYMLQHATNTADATTFVAPIMTTAARYYLGGQTPGATVYFRVAALDTALTGGQTGFTAWVAVMVSG
jgi:hypothetical protein